MTRDEVGALALTAINDTPATGWSNEWLMRFAELVAAAEREACAQVCADIPLPAGATDLTHLPTIERCVDAIRARGKKV